MLHYIDFQNMGLNHLPDLSLLKNLKRLNCDHNNLTVLPDLSGFTKLRVLYCGNNNLIKLPVLPRLTYLCYLNFENKILWTGSLPFAVMLKIINMLPDSKQYHYLSRTFYQYRNYKN